MNRMATQLSWGLTLLTIIILIPAASHAQQSRKLPKAHYFLDARSEPGVVAHAQIQRRLPGVGSFQAVSVSGPQGMKVALAKDGQFLEPLDAPVAVGMMVGAVYRVRVTNIPYLPGEELYPTIEVIGRINAPQGREHRFPIPIVLDEVDLRQAVDGALVTRVIYLEENEIAEPLTAPKKGQRVTNVGPSDNALQVADQMGQPVAILRIGSRVPSSLEGDLSQFLYGCAPWIPIATAPNREALIQSGQWPDTPPTEAAGLRNERPEADEPRTPPNF